MGYGDEFGLGDFFDVVDQIRRLVPSRFPIQPGSSSPRGPPPGSCRIERIVIDVVNRHVHLDGTVGEPGVATTVSCYWNCSHDPPTWTSLLTFVTTHWPLFSSMWNTLNRSPSTIEYFSLLLLLLATMRSTSRKMVGSFLLAPSTATKW